MRTRKLIKLITELRAIGAEAHFDLPRIAVIGNQSAGKSSLVEAISGITVPRATGTCTRCPMECRLTYSTNPWQCQVLLRREGATKGNEEMFGPLLTDPSDLEDMIRRAQVAILNPSTASASFVTGILPTEREHQFSSDVVCIDLAGPDVTDLAFIDLPGIISHVAPGEERASITAVRDMVQKHIQGDTLILLTITMRDDLNNQGAADLAHSEDVTGKRTIGRYSLLPHHFFSICEFFVGVLTKPDLIQPGEESGWVGVLEGTAHPLKHGYFITKQPSPKELEEQVTFREARDREKHFFQSQYPWEGLPGLRHRMGTPNLTKELSKLLASVINHALPDLRLKSKQRLQEIKEMLEALPPPLSENPVAELLRLVTRFSVDVEHVIRGSESFESLLQSCRAAYASFKCDIHGTEPIFKPFINEDEASDRYSPMEEASEVAFEEVIHEDPVTNDSGNTNALSPMYLEDVRAHIQKSLTRELPFNVPYRAKVTLIECFFADWEDYCQKCFDTIYHATLKEIICLVQRHFGQHSSTSLPGHVRSIVEDQIEVSRRKTQERIKWLLELERPPFTVNDHYFASKREKYLIQYKSLRLPTQYNATAVREALSALARIGYTGLTGEKLARLHGDDAYEEEMVVMAETMAYFHVSYKRIIDNLPRVIDLDFLRSIAKELQDSLIEGLSLAAGDATARAEGYLAEDPDVATRRASLARQRDMLEIVLQKIFLFGA
ncbi:unnamed protein product [Somion occarium]|uniref:Uncharacterized protein n=1 Tax=Somion occarium TaxID=3059160 RepID=A0ABP1DAY3_9APHY